MYRRRALLPQVLLATAVRTYAFVAPPMPRATPVVTKVGARPRRPALALVALAAKASSSSGGSSSARSISEFTTSELKQLLTERGIDFRDCLEKSELVVRLQSAIRDGVDPEETQLNSLNADEQSTCRLFQRCAASVGCIETKMVARNAPLLMRSVEVPVGSGSGFVWDTHGHIVTNYHVVANAGKAIVTGLGSGSEASLKSYEAVLVGTEPEKDIAVLKVNAPASVLRPIDVGSSSELLVGQTVFAIGNPFGLDSTLTRGIVSAVGREVQGAGGRPIKGCIQTDAAINPGNSGGPLLDTAGRLIGVNTAIYSPSGASAGIGFAIPVDTVRRIVNQLIRYGRMVRPSLGIAVADDQLTNGAPLPFVGGDQPGDDS